MTLVFLLIYMAAAITIILAISVYFFFNRNPKIYINGRKIVKEDLQKTGWAEGGIVRVQSETKRGAILMPDSDIEEERQRIIKERSERGLDTPVDLLRERSNEE